MPRRAAAIALILLLLAPFCGLAAAASAPAKAEPATKTVPAAKAVPPAKGTEEDDYELQRILVDTIDQVQRNYVREIPRRKIVEAAIKGILNELDPYSNYIAPDEMDHFRTTVESEFGGIGVQVSIDGGQLRVMSPLVGTPAYRAGLIAGDRIIEIDGKSAANITMDEAVHRLKGKEGTTVTLTVIHPAQTRRETITITRQAIHVETILGHHRKPDDTWDYFVDSQKKIAYLRLTAFSRDTAADLRKVMTAIAKEKLRGLVLDLRFNPGGLLSSAIEVSDLFVADGRIVSVSGRNSPERVWNAHKPGTFAGFPMVVLVNRYSASASEIVSACLQDHHRAKIVGERTWGKGSVQNVIPLDEFGNPSGDDTGETHSALKLTTAGYHRPSGKNIDRAPGSKETDDWGVRPDSGYELKLDELELLTLISDRRQRDIIQPKSLATAGPTATPPASAPKPEPKPAPDATAQVATGPKAGAPVSFVDRQLQMAVNFLTGELARAN